MAKWHERKDLKADEHMVVAVANLKSAARGNRLMFVINLLVLIGILYFLFRGRF